MLFANNANTTLASSLTNVSTTMSVTSASAFPSPTGSQYFYCTLADAATQTTIEIVKVTAVSGTTFTIVRGQDGTTGTIFASGAVVSLRLVAASLNDFPKLDEANTFTQAQTFSALTSGRVPYSTTGGLQTDNANLTFDGTNLSIGGAVTSTIASKTAAFGAAGGSIYTSYYDGTKTWRSGAGIESSGVFSFYNVTDATNPLNLFASGGVSIGNTTDPGAGNLRFNTTGTNGIYFGSSSRLDDYETGTWTPVDGSGAGLSLTIYSATYIRVGRMVFASFDIAYPVTANTSFNRLLGVPYTMATGSWSCAVSYATAAVATGGLGNGGATSLDFYGAGSTRLINSALSGKEVAGCLIFQV